MYEVIEEEGLGIRDLQDFNLTLSDKVRVEVAY